MELLKDVFQRDGVVCLARLIQGQLPSFDVTAFTQEALADWTDRSLMQRSEQIYRAIKNHLLEDFPRAAKILTQCLHPHCDGNAKGEGTSAAGVQGWMVLPLAEFAGREGLPYLEIALEMLQQCTMRFTAEFGIRPLWEARPQQVMAIVSSWVHHENEHVRRLVSEGARPRLPWGKRLRQFEQDPESTHSLLLALRDDSSAYVRKSVANHLNDIAHRHPQWVLATAQRWLVDAPLARQRLVKHALRNLLKQACPEALALYQLQPPLLQQSELAISDVVLPMGGDLFASLILHGEVGMEQQLRIDLVVHYRKANGSLQPRVFRWCDLRLGSGERRKIQRKLSFRPMTTRVHYPGRHRVEVHINGKMMSAQEFCLVVP